MGYTYYNENGKLIRGAAAYNHLIYTVCGGMNNFGNIVGSAAVMKYKESNSSLIKQIMNSAVNITRSLTLKK